MNIGEPLRHGTIVPESEPVSAPEPVQRPAPAPTRRAPERVREKEPA
jgi:hypothetical protein